MSLEGDVPPEPGDVLAGTVGLTDLEVDVDMRYLRCGCGPSPLSSMDFANGTDAISTSREIDSVLLEG